MNKFSGKDRDWSPEYSAIGKFVSEFELTCFFIRIFAKGVLQINGLKNSKLAEIVFNQRVFTAEPLFSCYSSLVAECLEADHPLLKDVAEIRKEFQSLCKTRNDLLHATYLIGPDVIEVTDSESPSEFYVEKRTPNKDGGRVQRIVESLEELEGHSETARAIRKRVMDLGGKVIREILEPNS